MFRIPGYGVLLAKTKRLKEYRDRKEGPILPTVMTAVRNCILNHWPLYITYEAEEEDSLFKRWCLPFVWGISKFTGNNLVRAYVYKGKTQTFYGWKTLRMDRIRNTAVLSTQHFLPKPLYNPFGDEDFSEIILQAKFNPDQYPDLNIVDD